MSSRQSKLEKEREKATQDRLQAMLGEMLKVSLAIVIFYFYTYLRTRTISTALTATTRVLDG